MSRVYTINSLILTKSFTQTLTELLQSFSGFHPELGLLLLFVVLILADLFFHKQVAGLTGWIALLGFGGILFLMARQCCVTVNEDSSLFLGLLGNSNLTVLFKSLFVVLGILTILFSWTEQKSYPKRGEFFSILTAILLGLNLMVMSRNFLLLYLGIELVSIGSYILTYFSESRKSAEGSLKYVLFGAMSSGIMLYGMSWLYGLTGTMAFSTPDFWTSLAAQPPLLANIALLLVLSGLLFKISAVPFHVWAPDVYDAAPIAVVAFFSVAPKVAALVILLVISQAGASQWPGFQTLMAIISLASITVGNLGALLQKNARRLLAYSSIAHAGFLLIGIVATGLFATQSFLFYVIVYLFMNLAAFVLVHWLERNTQSSTLADYQGLGLQFPGIGIAVVISMIALAGLPPTAGFTAKLLLFSALWESYRQSGELLLLVLFGWGLFNLVIAVFYYLRIPYLLFFRKREKEEEVRYRMKWLEVVLLVGVLTPVLVLFFKSDLLTESLSLFLR